MNSMLKKTIIIIPILLCAMIITSCGVESETSELHENIQSFEFEAAREIISRGDKTEINSLSIDGATCIQECISQSEFDGSSLEIIELLLRNGADINQKGKGEYKGTALDFLMTRSPIMFRHFDTIYQLLIKNGAVHSKETLENCLAGESKFEYAESIFELLESADIETDISETMRALILKRPDEEIISLLEKGRYKKSEKNNIAFLTAANCGVDVMKTLEDEDFDFTQTTIHRMSLIDIAAAYNSPEMIEYLIGAGQDPEASESGYEADDGDEEMTLYMRSQECESYTSISFALVNAKEKNIDCLIKNGNDFQENSWCIACFCGGKGAIDILLEHDFPQEQYYIFQCYTMADDDIVKYMLDNNVDYNVSAYGESLLESLKNSGQTERYDLIVNNAEKEW